MRPTIQELDAILNQPEGPPVQVMPDGQVRAYQGEVMGGQGEAPMCNTGGRDYDSRERISIQRRRELMTLAADASDWIIQHNIKPHELCFFKQVVSMLTERD